MFFSLTFIETHRIYELQEALLSFFQRCASNTSYSLDCFPEWFRSTLTDSDKLRERFELVAKLIQSQDNRIRIHILAVFENNNRIQELCENTNLSLEILDDIEEEINGVKINLKKEIKDLFDYLYENVLGRNNLFNNGKDLSIKQHHEEFREKNEVVCPFCGMGIYPDMKAEYDKTSKTYNDKTNRRSNYDHYLARKSYPLAAVNFKNLVPMCEDCNNSPNKGSKDILFTSDERTTRRKAFYPYSENSEVKLSVLCEDWSIYNTKGTWNAEITPSSDDDSEKVETWNNVFNISSRLSNRIRGHNRTWLMQFFYSVPRDECNVEALRERFRIEAQKWSKFKKTAADSIVKEAFFSYLAQRATETEVISFCSNLGYMRAFKNPT
ncbi:MAG TPA: hypothetical protein VF571_15690 [Pyrinomonadaceae bacterium]|jgi:hypothetical protein